MELTWACHRPCLFMGACRHSCTFLSVHEWRLFICRWSSLFMGGCGCQWGVMLLAMGVGHLWVGCGRPWALDIHERGVMVINGWGGCPWVGGLLLSSTEGRLCGIMSVGGQGHLCGGCFYLSMSSCGHLWLSMCGQSYSYPQKVTKHLGSETIAEWISILFGGCQDNIKCSISPNFHNI